MNNLNITIEKAIGKANLPIGKMLLLGFLAGAFISFGAEFSNMCSFNLVSSAETYGIGRCLAGLVFSVGLMMVILAGAELFTGNCLMICGVLDNKITFISMLKNWIFVYIGNLIGALFIAWMMNQTGLFASGAGVLGAMTVKIGAGKTSLVFGRAVVLGILCNWLVCIAVWMAFAAENTVGKMLSCLFPIWLFVASGFEHSIANMYYIPAAIMAKGEFGQHAMELGLSQEALDTLTWQGFFGSNLLPVTIGNIIGGCLFVGIAYYISYSKKN